jgi:hypothetical protein
MAELFETCISGANLGPTVLLGMVVLYWLFVIVGVFGLDLFDFDFDLDTDVGDVGDIGDVSGDFDGDLDADVTPGGASTALSFGAIVLKSVNIGKVPLMVWLSAFALSMWLITVLWDKPATHEDLGRELVILFRNTVLAVMAAKLLTQPLRGQFEDVEAQHAKDLVGRACAVTTPELTDENGQIRCDTGAAPLLLNARTKKESEPLKKGDSAVIVGYQRDQGIYYVEKAQTEEPS